MDEFEWDTEKAKANLTDHHVSFEEALTVFADPLAAIFDDPDHSAEERRELIIGRSTKQNLSGRELYGTCRPGSAHLSSEGDRTRAAGL